MPQVALRHSGLSRSARCHYGSALIPRTRRPPLAPLDPRKAEARCPRSQRWVHGWVHRLCYSFCFRLAQPEQMRARRVKKAEKGRGGECSGVGNQRTDRLPLRDGAAISRAAKTSKRSVCASSGRSTGSLGALQAVSGRQGRSVASLLLLAPRNSRDTSLISRQPASLWLRWSDDKRRQLTI